MSRGWENFSIIEIPSSIRTTPSSPTCFFILWTKIDSSRCFSDRNREALFKNIYAKPRIRRFRRSRLTIAFSLSAGFRGEAVATEFQIDPENIFLVRGARCSPTGISLSAHGPRVRTCGHTAFPPGVPFSLSARRHEKELMPRSHATLLVASHLARSINLLRALFSLVCSGVTPRAFNSVLVRPIRIDPRRLLLFTAAFHRDWSFVAYFRVTG